MSAGSDQHHQDGRQAAGQVWRFADCEFDELRRELRVRGTAVEIEAKPLEVLQQLLRHAGEVVTKDELFDSVWPGLAVVEGSLATAVSKLRKVLGSGDTVVKTVSRVGYRLAVPVQSKPIAPPPWPELDLAAGDAVLGRPQWRLLRRLDLSPSSDVWLAEHPKTHERRVFKFASDVEQLRGLKREVTLARLLRQSLGKRSDFVPLLEWNFNEHPYFIESEYCGPNLAEWAESQGGLSRIPLELRLRLLVDVARAVADAHSIDVLHKDLKPGNILVSVSVADTPQIKVADFGSASLLAPGRLAELGITNLGFTQSGDAGSLTGTVLYLAPELLGGQSPSAASDVYSLGVLLYQLIAGDFRRPFAPGWEADIADPLLREDIAQAAAGDPSRRFTTAAELVDRLVNLDSRRREAERIAQAERRARADQHRRAAVRARSRWLVFAMMAVVAAVVLTATLSRRGSAPRVKTLAVLPFQNIGSDTTIDFLRIALPEEVANTLSHARGIAVRPFATTSKYDPATLDLEKLGRELRVDGVVTGRFVKIGSALRLTLEGIDLEHNRSVWRDTLDSAADSLIATQVQIALRVRRGLVPAFGGSLIDGGGQPKNEEAYGLFLRSASLAFEAGPNPEGIGLLEKAVALDPTYAPAWLALARRYYVEAHYGHGTEALMDRYEAAMERAVSLDPNYAPGAAGLVISRVERGDLVGAYARAEDLVRRRPDSADAHFALSYVFRFAGMLQESGEHCESALLLDPHSTTAGLRSCAIAFFERGDYPHATNFQRLYLGSDWAKAFLLDILVREGKLIEAKQIGAPHIPQWPSYDMLAACVERRPTTEILALADAVEPAADPEQNYLAASHLAYCGLPDAALDMLSHAIKGNYCSTAALSTDRVFEHLRQSPRFEGVRAAATECQRTFLAARRRSN